MNQIVPINQRAFSEQQIALVKRTVARDCSEDEFDHFMAVAQRLGLDPLRKQICATVFSKGDATRRNMAIIVQIDGLRAIAQRCGDYRPMETAPIIEYDPSLKGPANPLGIVRAEVRLWKRAGSEWHPVAGEAFWDEFAPLKEEAAGGYDWVDTGEVWADSGKPKKKKVARGEVTKVLDPHGNWPRMGRVMIAKCAEAQALRRGWPEQFSGVYAEEEMQRAIVIDAASEVVAQHEEAERLKRVGSGPNTVLFQFGAGAALSPVPLGQLADRVIAFARSCTSKRDLDQFTSVNKAALQEFWARAPGDALGAKKEIEARAAALATAEDFPGDRA